MNRRGFFGLLAGVLVAARSPRKYWRWGFTGTNAAPIEIGDWVPACESPQAEYALIEYRLNHTPEGLLWP